MRRWMMVLFLLPVTLWTASPVTAATGSGPLVSASIFAKATKVAICEEGGWVNVHGPTYFGALGWLQATWETYRARSFPARMDEATPSQQAWAMAHFVGAAMGGWWPDQVGCTGGY